MWFINHNRIGKDAVPTLFLRDVTSQARTPLMNLSSNEMLSRQIGVPKLPVQHIVQREPQASCSSHPALNDPLPGSAFFQNVTKAVYGKPKPMQHIRKRETFSPAVNKLFLGGQNYQSGKKVAFGCQRHEVKKRELIRELKNIKIKLRRTLIQKASFENRLKRAKKYMQEKGFRLIKHNINTATNLFLNMQQKFMKSARGRRFTLDEKILALSIYKPSPKAYRLLHKLFVLTSPRTINVMLQGIQLKPGINKIIMNHLKERVSTLKHETHKICCLLFDEMKIMPQIHYKAKEDEIVGFVDNGIDKFQEFADHVLVFMVRGVIKKYKQAISYSFCSGTTKAADLVRQIESIISALQSTGLIIVATVCDQSQTNRSAVKILEEKTRHLYGSRNTEWRGGFFTVNDNEIISLYDPPHLLKGIRNNLLEKELHYTTNNIPKVAKWEHIIKCFQKCPSFQGLRFAEKLTTRHILKNRIPKMRVKYAAQVFSKAVGKTMGCLTVLKVLPPETAHTAELLIFMDNLFDSVNGSSTKIKRGKIYRTAVTPNSVHHKLWNTSLPVLKSMKFLNKKGKLEKVPSINSWVKTIDGIKIVLNKLEKQYQIKLVLLRTFNQDPLEIFFAGIRSHGFRNNMPNTLSYEAACKTLMLNNFLTPKSIGYNCKEDTLSCLQSLKYLFSLEEEIEDSIPEIYSIDSLRV